MLCDSFSDVYAPHVKLGEAMAFSPRIARALGTTTQKSVCRALLSTPEAGPVAHPHAGVAARNSLRFASSSSSSVGKGASKPVAPTGFTITGESLPGRAAYLDMQATTPLDPRVLDAMMPFYVQQYGNPHSRTHEYGWEAEAAVETARKQG